MIYPSHRRRLLPALATTYVLSLRVRAGLRDARRSTEVMPSGEIDRSARARGAGRRPQGDRDVARDAHRAGVPRGVRWRRATSRSTGCPTSRPTAMCSRRSRATTRCCCSSCAKSLLTGYKDSFESLDTLGTVRFVARQVAGGLVERTALRGVVRTLLAAAPGKVGDGDLRDRAVQLRLLVDRERHVLEGLANRFRSVARSSDPFAGFNAAQDDLLTAARFTSSGWWPSRSSPRSSGRGRRGAGAAGEGLRPARARDDRARPGLVHGRRLDHAGRAKTVTSLVNGCSTSCARTRSRWSRASASGRAARRRDRHGCRGRAAAGGRDGSGSGAGSREPAVVG